MKASLLKFYEDVRASYWFIPTVFSGLAVLLAGLLLSLDAAVGVDALENMPWFYETGASGAREFLSTVAGSIITVAGVVFSITIAAVAHASAQFGPRLLHNFMRDRGNQTTLGIFIATFLYCLLILRTVKDLGDDELFVPHISVMGGLFLAISCVAFLIYFIHHIPDSIHGAQVVARVGKSLDRRIEDIFPENIGKAAEEIPPENREDIPEGFHTEARRVESPSTGYIQNLDGKSLLEIATENDLVLQNLYGPGDFVTEGRPIVLAWPSIRVSKEVESAVRNCFAFGDKRTYQQDILFLVDELVETGARALSTGINDPFTARQCMDWLGNALVKVARRDMPDPGRYDDDGKLRLMTKKISFSLFTGAIFDQFRPYVSTDLNAALHMLQMIGEVGLSLQKDDQRKDLVNHADALYSQSLQHLTMERDRQALGVGYRAALQSINRNDRSAVPPHREDWY
jgi:uncharacterized membrane protein